MSDLFCYETLIPALTDWVQSTRHNAARLDDEADALLLRLLQAEDRVAAIGECQRSPATLALGDTPSGARMFSLCHAACVPLAGIAKGHIFASAATRFTLHRDNPAAGYPLRLRLLRESELVQLFIHYARSHGTTACPPAERLAQLRNRGRQPETTAVTPQETARLAAWWQRTVPPQQDAVAPELWYTFAELIPTLSLADRASAWSTLWGDRHDLTARWLELAGVLERLNGAQTVLAPAEVLEWQPQEPTSAESLLVRPLASEQALAEVRVAPAQLAALCIEVIFSGGDAIPCDVLVLPPLGEPVAGDALATSKRQFLPDYYLQRRQWDLLLDEERLRTEGIGPVLESADRAAEVVQRDQRFSAEERRIYALLSEAFAPWRGRFSRAEVKETIGALQRQAQCHGEWLEALLPTAASVARLSEKTKIEPLFDTSINLFAGEEGGERDREAHRYGDLLYRNWVNSLRLRVRDPRLSALCGVSEQVLQRMGEILIVTGYRLNLAAELEHAAQRSGACGGGQTLAHFLCWLGYAQIPQKVRPVSRVTHRAIFAAADSAHDDRRLARLSDHTQYAATSYVYDWLVALYTRACENLDYCHPQDIDAADRQRLVQIFGG